MSAMKEYNLSRHCTSKHSKFENIRGHKREEKIKRLLKFVLSQQAVFKKVVAESEDMVRTSYAIAERIATNSKPFSDGGFVPARWCSD